MCRLLVPGLLLAAGLALISPGHALSQDVGAKQGSIASGHDTNIAGDIYLDPTPDETRATIERTLSAPELLEAVQAAARGGAIEGNERVRALSDVLNIRDQALARMFEILESKNMPPERLAEVLAEIAGRHKTLLERVRLLEASDPRVAKHRDAAARAIGAGEYERADALLAKAEAIELAAMRQPREALDQRALNAAAIRAQRGEVARTRLDYGTAAEHFRTAADLVPAGQDDVRADDLHRQAAALYAQGEEFGDNAALQQAIDVWHDVLALRPRARVPLDWALTQANLGSALAALGEREAATAHLEEAVTAYRAALEELPRARVPLDWAQVQMNLGNALWTLGERGAGTARLEEAVAAYHLALEEWTRERAPLQWAATQNNLGSALIRLGEREAGTARLGEALAAFRLALEEWTRELAPLDWARVQMNLGNVLRLLGERESGPARLEEAVAAYRLALEEWTRELAPLDWAMAQMNLGSALWRLGERTSDLNQLKAARTAIENAHDLYVAQPGYEQYDAAFQDRLSALERLIADLEQQQTQ